MNRKLIAISLVVLAVFAFSVYQRNRNRQLPDGKITTDDRLPDSAFNTTPSAITGRPQVEVNTPKGKFVMELRPDVAPKTVANFLAKWNAGECDDLTFHRVEEWVVQGCDPKGDGTGGETTLPTETSSQTFTAGSVGVARRPSSRDVSNDSQFFIVKKDSTFLDREYTYFGRVVSGMDVVNKLSVGDKILSTDFLGK